VLATQLPLVLVGWSLVGLGVGMIAPQIYGTAGNLGGGRVMGVVVGFGYTAFLTGPALIGTVADHAGIARAMLVPLATGIALVVMARWMPSVEHQPAAPPHRPVLPETEA
jgi:MFS family permease